MAHFPSIVREYLKLHEIKIAKPEDVFSIVTLKLVPHEAMMEAYLTYDHEAKRAAIVSVEVPSSPTARYDALIALLVATESELTTTHVHLKLLRSSVYSSA